MPEMALGTKNGQLHGRIFFVVKGGKEQRVPPKSRSAIHCDDIKRYDCFFELIPHARDRVPLNSARPGVAIVRLSMRTPSTDMKNWFFSISIIPRLYVGITNGWSFVSTTQ